MTWPNAEKACVSAGGHLASILSVKESDFITNHVLNGTRYNISWIGLNDRDNEHTFVWSDGSPVLIVSWSRHQPSDFDGQQNCVTVNHTHGHWNDLSCGSRRPFVCKRPKSEHCMRIPFSACSFFKKVSAKLLIWFDSISSQHSYSIIASR